jgi:predicted MPP superfamily phosphohydrolase
MINIFVLIIGLSVNVFAQNFNPQRIILNLTESPHSSVAVTWRTIDKVDQPMAQIAKATDWTEFEDSLLTYEAKIEKFITDEGQQVWYYSVIFSELKPSTKYFYRVGAEDHFTEWIQFTTADDEPTPFQFIYFGDPQNHNKKHVTKVLREAYTTAPEADFWLFSGDIIGDPEDYQIAEFFYAGNPFNRMVPQVMIPGNHDRKYQRDENGEYVREEDGDRIRLREIDPYWHTSFTLPENGIDGLEETSYYFDYQGVRFIMINSNDKREEQAVWMEKILKNNDNNWTIVTFHHPVYSAGRDRDRRETRDIFSPLFDKYNVDLVLTGHDHAYARSHKLKAGEIVDENEQGTVYIVSVSGPKMYSVNSNYEHLMVKTGGYAQLFQVLDVSENKISYKSYTLTGKVFDSFELTK